jgi:quinol monooxygenase YgiN
MDQDVGRWPFLCSDPGEKLPAGFKYRIIMSKQITTIARLKAKPGAESQLEDVLKSLIEPTRAESGCIDYTMHRDVEEPGVYYFYDNWRSQEDLDAHFEMPHMKRIIEMAPELLAEPLKIIRLEKLG